ncbi:MAG: hypothetical protein CVV45_18250 [Spirochaetae bacterium HGW-Spirochaetae-10]|nr:MAG: hypothetical protein CVV45_18250 [Spirochaetae bacterium HGW-Spirochaetae-10]
MSVSLTDYDCLRAGRRIEEFVDSLSNWYIRRNRRRFWKGEKDADKLAAYDTLHTCLRTLAVLMAPFTPYLAEDLFRRLRSENDPESVHLCAWPEASAMSIDEAALRDGDNVLLVASLGRSARQRSGRKVRQPLSEVMVFAPSAAREAIRANETVLLEELNVKTLTFLDDAGGYFGYVVKPNLPVLGKKIGSKIRFLQAFLKKAEPADLVARLKAGSIDVDLDGESVTLEEEEFLIEGISKEGTSGAESKGFVVVIDTELNDELIREGMVRDIVRQIQEMRKKASYDISDRIQLSLKATGSELEKAVAEFQEYIEGETLATVVASVTKADATDTVRFEQGEVTIAIQRKK